MPALDPFAQLVAVALGVGLLALLLWASHQYRGRGRTDVGWPVLLALLYVGAFGLAARVGFTGLFLAFSLGVAWTWFLGWHLLYTRLPRGWRHVAFGVVAGICCTPVGVPIPYEVLGSVHWLTLHVPALFALVLAVPSAQELRFVLAASACPWLITTAAAILVSLGAGWLSRARQHRQTAAAAPGEPHPDCWTEPPGRFPHLATVIVGFLLTAATAVGMPRAAHWYTEALASGLVGQRRPKYPLAVEANLEASLQSLVWEHVAAHLPAAWREPRTGRTLLHAAARQGDLRPVQLLLAAGADVNAADNDQDTPLSCAARAGHADVVARLLKAGAKVSARDYGGKTALHWAADLGNAQTVELLLQVGADVNAASKDQCTPLFYAARAGHADIVARLLMAGATVTARDYRGKTALHWAVVGRNPRAVDLLLQAGADANAADNAQWTPLFYAARAGQADIVARLLKAGGKVTARDTTGRTALHRAVVGGNPQTVELLLQAGADVNAKNSDGQTPADLAREGSHPEILKLLESHGGTPGQTSPK